MSVEGVNVSAIDDGFFARDPVEKKEGEDALFEGSEGKKVTVVSAQRKAAQSVVDSGLSANIVKVPMLAEYLKAKFTLSKSDLPHRLSF